MNGKSSKIWSVNQKGKPISFLIGSIHLPNQLFPRLTEYCQEIISSVEIIATETPLDIDPSTYLTEIYWGDQLTDKRRQKWQALMKRWSMPDLSFWYTLPPILLLNYLQVHSLSQGAQGTVLDEWIYKKGLESGKKCLGLIPPDEHYGLLQKIPTLEQLRMLKRFFKNPAQTRKKSRRMLELYAQSDLHALYKHTSGQLGEYRGLLLRERNEKMAYKIHQIMRENTGAFVVGAAHLSGLHGLLHLLKAKYSLEVKPAYKV